MNQLLTNLARKWVYVCLLIPTVFVVPFLFQHWNLWERSLNHLNKRSLNNATFDIDIGTNGRIMDTEATTIITFDPTDKQTITPQLESYPFGIADFNGNATFYVNRKFPACNSLNIRNEFYNFTIRDELVAKRCGDKKFQGGAYLCQHAPDLETIKVPVRSLSSFLKQRGISTVNKVKIDAQGSDFAIIKDLFENTPNFKLNSLMFECQDYDQGMPLYFASNDCTHIVEYLKNRFPNLKYSKQYNNCLSAEYNIKIDFTKF